MSYVRLVMLEEAAAQTVGSLGKNFGHLHVIDKGQIEGPHYKKHKVCLMMTKSISQTHDHYFTYTYTHTHTHTLALTHYVTC
jgi:hypothetical protein